MPSLFLSFCFIGDSGREGTVASAYTLWGGGKTECWENHKIVLRNPTGGAVVLSSRVVLASQTECLFPKKDIQLCLLPANSDGMFWHHCIIRKIVAIVNGGPWKLAKIEKTLPFSSQIQFDTIFCFSWNSESEVSKITEAKRQSLPWLVVLALVAISWNSTCCVYGRHQPCKWGAKDSSASVGCGEIKWDQVQMSLCLGKGPLAIQMATWVHLHQQPPFPACADIPVPGDLSLIHISEPTRH